MEDTVAPHEVCPCENVCVGVPHEVKPAAMCECTPTGKRLAVFDFDGTLFRSPTPCPDRWDRCSFGYLTKSLKHGGVGWFQSLCSLQTPLVPQIPHKGWFVTKVCSRVRECMQDHHCVTVLVSERTENCVPRITEILGYAGLVFDHIKCVPLTGSCSFPWFKKMCIQRLSYQHKTGVTEVWEDDADVVGVLEQLPNTTVIRCSREAQIHPSKKQEFDVVKQMIDENATKKKCPTKPESIPPVPVALSYISWRTCVDVDPLVVTRDPTIIPTGWDPCTTPSMTMWLGTFEGVLHADHIGKKVSLTVTAVGRNASSMAYRVRDPPVPCADDIPHITIAVSPGGGGLSARESGTTVWESLPTPFVVRGRVCVKRHGKVTFPHVEHVLPDDDTPCRNIAFHEDLYHRRWMADAVRNIFSSWCHSRHTGGNHTQGAKVSPVPFFGPTTGGHSTAGPRKQHPDVPQCVVRVVGGTATGVSDEDDVMHVVCLSPHTHDAFCESIPHELSKISGILNIGRVSDVSLRCDVGKVRVELSHSSLGADVICSAWDNRSRSFDTEKLPFHTGVEGTASVKNTVILRGAIVCPDVVRKIRRWAKSKCMFDYFGYPDELGWTIMAARFPSVRAFFSYYSSGSMAWFTNKAITVHGETNMPPTSLDSAKRIPILSPCNPTEIITRAPPCVLETMAVEFQRAHSSVSGMATSPPPSGESCDANKDLYSVIKPAAPYILGICRNPDRMQDLKTRMGQILYFAKSTEGNTPHMSKNCAFRPYGACFTNHHGPHHECCLVIGISKLGPDIHKLIREANTKLGDPESVKNDFKEVFIAVKK